jgi:hypothetical protein
MTFGKFFGLGFVLAILAAAIKVFYFQALNPDSVGVMYVLGVFLVIITIACDHYEKVATITFRYINFLT